MGWRVATKPQRKDLLNDFIQRYHGAHLFESRENLDDDLGSSAGLYLSRILSWLRLHCSDGDGLDLHIHAISIFVRCGYIQELIDMEGVPVLLYVLTFPSQVIQDNHCMLVIQLLQTIGRCGRAFKEYISLCGGEHSVIDCCIHKGHPTCTSPLWLTCRTMLLGQCCGNPNSVGTTAAAVQLMLDHESVPVQCLGSQVLRELVYFKSPHYDVEFTKRFGNLIPLAIKMLAHDSCKVQYEALELVHIALDDRSTHHALADHLLQWLRQSAMKAEHEVAKTVEEFYEVECFTHLKSPVLRICRSLDSTVMAVPTFADLVVDRQGLDALVYIILVATEGSLKWLTACLTLLRLCAIQEDAFGIVASICQHSTAFVREILSDKACRLLSNADDMPDEIDLNESMDMLLGDADRCKSIWKYLHHRGWPLQSPVPDAEDADPTLGAIEAQVEATMSTVRQDFEFHDGLLADDPPPKAFSDHVYIQKLHTHFQHYRLRLSST
ncbi:hypothetical protein AeMF1_001181 [Aphanomyces euteiches]|nr:hypothetical protein AeMF1_001181 [Aphanomyces euteiches]